MSQPRQPPRQTQTESNEVEIKINLPNRTNISVVVLKRQRTPKIYEVSAQIISGE